MLQGMKKNVMGKLREAEEIYKTLDMKVQKHEKIA